MNGSFWAGGDEEHCRAIEAEYQVQISELKKQIEETSDAEAVGELRTQLKNLKRELQEALSATEDNLH